MTRFSVTKDIPIQIIVEAESEEEALEYTDDKWRLIWNSIEKATDGIQIAAPGKSVTIGYPYDDIEVEEIE